MRIYDLSIRYELGSFESPEAAIVALNSRKQDPAFMEEVLNEGVISFYVVEPHKESSHG